MTDCVLGIDIGTTATKLILLDRDGKLRSEINLPCQLYSTHPGWSEENAGEWWDNVCQGIPRVLHAANLKSSQIAGIGVSGMVPALVALDEHGNVLRHAMLQNDARAVQEIDSLRTQTNAEDVLKRTGSAITQQSIGPKILWLRNNEPQIFQKTHHFMGSYDYIVHHLTGELSAERNWALESGLYDLQTEDWDEHFLALAGIYRNQLGTLHFPSEIVGRVNATAASACGLAEGTPVVAGCADHIASALSAGLRSNGDLLVKLGGSGDILYILDRPETDPRLYLDYHAVPGQFVLNGCMAASGSLIRWFRDQFVPGKTYAELDAEADKIPAGSEGLLVLPYFLGEKTPIHDPLARGTVVGLTLAHTYIYLYRAMLEGIGFGFRHHLQVLVEHGCQAPFARVTNGGAHSQLWRQITSDVLGMPLHEIAGHPGSSLGAAFVAGMRVGLFKDWGEVDKLVAVASTTQPRLEKSIVYERQYKLYLETYERLKKIFPELGEID